LTIICENVKSEQVLGKLAKKFIRVITKSGLN